MEKTGFDLDVDTPVGNDMRVVQMTPPGSACSVAIGGGITIRHIESGAWSPGPHPDRGDYESFADFSDPVGNTWVLQERGWGGAGP